MKNHQTDRQLAEQIVSDIAANINDRRGIKWDGLDDEIRVELTESLTEIVEEHLNDAGGVFDLRMRVEGARQAAIKWATEADVNHALVQSLQAKKGELERMNSVKDGRILVLESHLEVAEKRADDTRQVLVDNDWVMTNAVWEAVQCASPEGRCKHCGFLMAPKEDKERRMNQYIIQNQAGEQVSIWPAVHDENCFLRQLVERYFDASQRSRKLRGA